MGLGDFIHYMGQSMAGGYTMPGMHPQQGTPAQGQDQGQAGQGRQNPFGNWTEEPVQNGMGFAQAPQLPQRNSGILQSIMGEQSAPTGGSMGGLHALLTSLGVFH